MTQTPHRTDLHPGDPGDQGDQGDQGDPGDPGDPADAQGGTTPSSQVPALGDTLPAPAEPATYPLPTPPSQPRQEARLVRARQGRQSLLATLFGRASTASTGTATASGTADSDADVDADLEVTGFDLLAAPLDHTDLAESLRAHRPGGRPATSTALLAGLVVAGIAFTGGVYTEKTVQPTATTGARGGNTGAGGGRSFGTGLPGTTGGAGATGAGSGAGASAGAGTAAGAGAGATFGTIKLVDGSTVYVQGADGSITKVLTGPGTTVRISSSGTVKQLAPGTTVVVQGTATGTGTLQASSISQGSFGGGTGGRGFGGTGGSSSGTRSGGG